MYLKFYLTTDKYLTSLTHNFRELLKMHGRRQTSKNRSLKFIDKGDIWAKIFM